MPERPAATELSVLTDDGVELSGQQTGESSSPSSPPIVLLHGLTATRRYVVMGSRVLERSGLRVISYDARGHGRSAPPPNPGAYGYERLSRDLLAILDALDIERAILAGASMGAHTIARFALRHPERVAALGLITPAYDPAADTTGPDAFAEWDALRGDCAKVGWRGFSRRTTSRPCPAHGERRSKRSFASGCRPTTIPRRWRTHWRSCRARAHSRASRS